MLKGVLRGLALAGVAPLLGGCLQSQVPLFDGLEPSPALEGEILAYVKEDSGTCTGEAAAHPPVVGTDGTTYCYVGVAAKPGADGWQEVAIVAEKSAEAPASIAIRVGELAAAGRPLLLGEFRMTASGQAGYVYFSLAPFAADPRIFAAMPLMCNEWTPESEIVQRDNLSCTVTRDGVAATAAAGPAAGADVMLALLVPTVEGESILTADIKPGDRGSPEYEEQRQRMLEEGQALLAELQAEREALLLCLEFPQGFCEVHDGRAVLRLQHQEGWYLPDGRVLDRSEWPR